MGSVRGFLFFFLGLSLCAHFVVASDPSPTDLLDDLQRILSAISAHVEAGEVKPSVIHDLVAEATRRGNQLEAHPAATIEQRRDGLVLEAQVLLRAARTDRPKYLDTYRKVISDLVAAFPPGDDSSASAELDLIALEYEKVSETCPDAFLKRMADFAKSYPAYLNGPGQIAIYARGYVALDNLPLAKEILQKGLEIYPGNKFLRSELELMSMPGTPAKLSTTRINGEPFDLESQKGKVVLLDFWATWCGPCREMTPTLKRLYAQYAGDGLEIVGFSLDRTVEPLKAYIQSHELGWIHLYEPDRKIRQEKLDAYHVVGIPTVFIVDREGKITSIGLHYPEEVEKEVRRALQAPTSRGHRK